MNNFIKNAAEVKPMERQIALQEMEFYSFIHFSMNTFTDREWGTGDEDPMLFNPTAFDPNQWVEACKAAGMKGLILTCKHHDGFCLWPSKYTEYSIKNSSWSNGHGDMVKEVAKACHEGGIKFGIYVSPWDLHEPSYGDSPVYNEFFRNQLEELLTGYGDIFCVWFDGACGEGSNGKRQEYDWDSYYDLIRELQPNAVISVCGPDIRWCGNEAGQCRESEWSVVPASLKLNERIQEKSQQVDDGEFAQKYDSVDQDLGSRDIIRDEHELIWYPAEVNTSIRPGWFYHASEDDRVKSLEQLVDIYYRSVGGNATFLLNLPPDRRGLIHENDWKRLQELGDRIRQISSVDIGKNAVVQASQSREGCDPEHILDGDKNTYWAPEEGTEFAVIEVDLSEESTFDHIMMQEYRYGQRIERYTLDYKKDGEWIPLIQGTVIGYKKICHFDRVTSQYIRLTIEESRWCPQLCAFEVYCS
ncbi:alpha-L-fucosidase [Paenibacillus sp. CMAA1364]